MPVLDKFFKLLRGTPEINIPQNEQAPAQPPVSSNQLDENWGDTSAGNVASQYREKLREADFVIRGTDADQIFRKVALTKFDIIQAVDEIRDFYLVNALLSTMVEDALKPNVVTDNVVDVKYGEGKGSYKHIQAEIDELDARFKFDSLAVDVAEEILAYGEFIYNTKITKKDGLVDIIDNSDQECIIPIVAHGIIQKYLVVREENISNSFRYSQNNIFEEKKPYEYLRFSLGSRKLRIKLSDSIWGWNVMPDKYRKELEKFPRYIRLGRSALYPIIGKIRELDLLEKLVPASQLSVLSSGTIVGVQVPENTTPEQALLACRKVENTLNKKVGVDRSNGYLTVEDVISSSGAYKCVPVFGQTGDVRKMDYKNDTPQELLSQIRDLRQSICSTIGFPYEIFYGSDPGEKKGEVLRRYSRYTSLLRSIQSAVIAGLKEMIIIHLSNKDGVPEFDPEQIHITCENKLVNINETEKLEFFDIASTMLQNFVNFTSGLNGPLGEDIVNKEPIANFINDFVLHAGIPDIIDVKAVATQQKESRQAIADGEDDPNKDKDKDLDGQGLFPQF